MISTAPRAFVLPNGAVAEGRPDIRALLNAIEPHDQTIRETALLARGLADARRSAAARSRSPQREGSPSSTPRYGAARGSSGGAPSSASSQAYSASSGGVVGVGGGLQPLSRPRPPSAQGALRLRERALTPRHPALQAARQHSLERGDRASSLSAFLATARGDVGSGGSVGGDGGGEMPFPPRRVVTPGGWGEVGVANASSNGDDEGGGGLWTAEEEASPGRPSSIGGGGGGGSLDFGGGGAVVRVGVPAASALSDAAAGATASATARLALRLGGSLQSSPMRAPARGRVSSTGTASAAELFYGDYALAADDAVAFKLAVRDLPNAAVKAVRRRMELVRNLTVADIHQRRPPYIDVGPQLDPSRTAREMHPEDFKRSLRAPLLSAAALPKRQAFLTTTVAAFTKSKNNDAGFDSFDYIAKERAIAYYISDFTAPSVQTMRPASRGTTRFAANVPSVLERNAERMAVGVTNRALLRVQQPHDEEAHSYAMSHSSSSIPPHPTLSAPGERLAPWPNSPRLAPLVPVLPSLNTTSSWRPRGTPRA